MFNSLTIGRPFGIRTSIHWTFWLLPGFILFSGFASGGLPMAVIDTAVILAVFGCVALHELGHALAARQFGIRTRDIVLYPLGGVASLERMPRSPGKEIAIALAGPAVNIAIAAVLAPLMILDGYHLGGLSYHASAVEIFWTKLLYANVGLVIFNMIPAFPMDGGRVLRAGLTWFTNRTTATEIAAAVGLGFAILFGLGSIFWNFGPMFLVMAVFLAITGQAELNHVRAEEAYRERPRRGGFFDYSAIRPATVPVHHADGWTYDPQSRDWTLWANGSIVKRITMT